MLNLLFCRNSQRATQQPATTSYSKRKKIPPENLYTNTPRVPIRRCTSELVPTALMKIYIFFPQLIKTNGVSWRDGLDCMLILQSSEFLKTLAKSSEFGSFVKYILNLSMNLIFFKCAKNKRYLLKSNLSFAFYYAI